MCAAGGGAEGGVTCVAQAPARLRPCAKRAGGGGQPLGMGLLRAGGVGRGGAGRSIGAGKLHCSIKRCHLPACTHALNSRIQPPPLTRLQAPPLPPTPSAPSAHLEHRHHIREVQDEEDGAPPLLATAAAAAAAAVLPAHVKQKVHHCSGGGISSKAQCSGGRWEEAPMGRSAADSPGSGTAAVMRSQWAAACRMSAQRALPPTHATPTSPTAPTRISQPINVGVERSVHEVGVQQQYRGGEVRVPLRQRVQAGLRVQGWLAGRVQRFDAGQLQVEQGLCQGGSGRGGRGQGGASGCVLVGGPIGELPLHPRASSGHQPARAPADEPTHTRTNTSPPPPSPPSPPPQLQAKQVLVGSGVHQQAVQRAEEHLQRAHARMRCIIFRVNRGAGCGNPRRWHKSELSSQASAGARPHSSPKEQAGQRPPHMLGSCCCCRKRTSNGNLWRSASARCSTTGGASSCARTPALSLRAHTSALLPPPPPPPPLPAAAAPIPL